MQNLRKGIIGGVVALGLAGSIYSFTTKGGGDDDKNKKYEGIYDYSRFVSVSAIY